MSSLDTAPGGWRIDQAARTTAIDALDLARLRDRPALKRITDFAAALCGSPVALVTLLEEQRQSFVARTGVDMTETPIEVAFCTHAVTGDGVLVVPDMTADARFAHNPLVTDDPSVRFYAGAPLRNADGVALGTLCVIDMAPHDGLTPLQRQGLEVLAEAVMVHFAADHAG